MANEHGQEITFVVYEIFQKGEVRMMEAAYSLIYVRPFDELAEAEEWIENEGERQRSYTVLKVIRNR